MMNVYVYQLYIHILTFMYSFPLHKTPKKSLSRYADVDFVWHNTTHACLYVGKRSYENMYFVKLTNKWSYIVQHKCYFREVSTLFIS